MPNSRFLLPIALLLGIVILAGCGGGDGPSTGQIKGKVFISPARTITTEDTGEIASEAEVLLLGTQFKAIADSNGNFSILNVPAGQYSLLISKIGYQSITIAINVLAGQIVEISSGSVTPVTRKWTILVYMNANNDLEQFGLLNFNQMESVATNDAVSVVVEFGRSSSYDTNDGNWAGTRRYLVRYDTDKNAIRSQLLQDMGLVDMGQPETMRDFISWGQQTFPADHYMVIVWNHGSGVLPFTKYAITKGISFDYTFGSYIRTQDMGAALASSPTVDCIAFDTCETQMAEIAYQIRQSCTYIIASEGDTPGTGYPYHIWLGELAANPDMPARTLATTMAKTMVDYYPNTLGVEQSVVDTTQMEGLATAVDNFADLLIPAVGTYPTEFAAARDTSDHYANSDYRDLLVFAGKIKASISDPVIDSAADGIITALQNALIAEYHGSDHPNIGGMAIYLPKASTFALNASVYRPLDFSERTSWPDYLAAQQQ